MSNNFDFGYYEGGTIVMRNIDNNIQYLLDKSGEQPRIFKSEEEARQILLNEGYCKERIKEYIFMDAVEGMKMFANEDGELEIVHDLGF